MAESIKQPLKKKTKEDFKGISNTDKMGQLSAFKQKINLDNVKRKQQEWLIMPKAFEDSTDCVGIPLGTVSCVKGHTNTGKSTFLLEVIKACQKQGILPVIFDLENSMRWYHAKEVGVEVGEYVDEETGELEYGPGEFMIYFDSNKLYEMYGLYDHSQSKFTTKPMRETYVIEDVALCIRELIAKQREGEIPFDMMYLVDSIGCSECWKGSLSRTSNNLWFAGALSTSFNVIGNDLIPGSMSVNSKYTNSMFYVNKVWTAMSPNGLPTAKEKGGASFLYFTRFSIFLGNQASSGVKRQSFTYKDNEYEYAIKVNIKIDKNHITNILHNGEICSTSKGLISYKDLDAYKKEYKEFLVEEIKKKTGSYIKVEDLGEKEVEEVEI